jgi:hypothetical protein
MIERRTYAQPKYPGFFFPEEGASVRVEMRLSAEGIAALFPDKDDRLGRWFAIEVTEQNWKLWESEEGGRKWEPAADGSRKSYRIYIGELLTREDVAALPGNHEILLRNMEYNEDCNPIMRTRCGNFQPFGENDVVLSEVSA